MFGTAARQRRASAEAGPRSVRVLLPPRVLHARLQRLAGEPQPAIRPTWRERVLVRLREPSGRRTVAHLAVATLPLVVSLVLLLLGVPGDTSLSW